MLISTCVNAIKKGRDVRYESIPASRCGRDMTYDEVAKAIGVNPSTLYRKACGQSEFTRSEIQKICEVLKINSPMDIFLPKNLRKRKSATALVPTDTTVSLPIDTGNDKETYEEGEK